MKIGDDVLILESAGVGSLNLEPGVTRVTTANESLITSLVAGGKARILNSSVDRYVATLKQSGTSAPVATVLDSSLSDTVVWTRSSSGVYVGTLAGAFTEGKTVIIQTDLLAIAQIDITVNTVTLTCSGDSVLTGQTLYLEVR